ncbi:MAG: hypothetical protein ACLPKE_26525 [Streptosporangiaceae bacterium]
MLLQASANLQNSIQARYGSHEHLGDLYLTPTVAVGGTPSQMNVISGAADAYFGTILTRDGGLATVVYGPGGKWIAHQADEHAETDDVVRHAQVDVAAARRLLAGEAASLSRAERQGRGRPTR